MKSKTGVKGKGLGVRGWSRLFAFAVILISFFLVSCKQSFKSSNQTNTKQTPTPTTFSRVGVYFPQTPASLNRTQSSGHFRAHFSSANKQEDVAYVLKILEDARNKMAMRLSNASLNIDEVPTCVIFIHDSTGNFTSDIKQSWQIGAVTRGISITMQPVNALRKRNSLESILRHEFVHVVVNAFRQKSLPRWLNEGTALYYSGEGAQLVKTVKNIKLTKEELEKKLNSQPSSEEMRGLYAASFREVSAIVNSEGETGLWKQIISP